MFVNKKESIKPIIFITYINATHIISYINNIIIKEIITNDYLNLKSITTVFSLTT